VASGTTAMSWLGRERVSRRRVLGAVAATGGALLIGRVCQPAGAAPAGEAAEAAIARLLGGRAATPSPRVSIEVPQKFDYGITVPLAVSVASPMTRADYVRRLHILVDGNPFPDVATLSFAPGSAPARAATRFRVEVGKHTIWAIAELSDGTALSATAELTTLAGGGCGGNSGLAPGTPEPAHTPRVKLPEHAGRGEVIEVPTMISHRMETGMRTDTAGNLLPRRIINRMECRYAGEMVFAADLTPAIAANAYLKFPICAVASGDVSFAWREDGGTVYRMSRHIEVD
jgi:predicted secreted protein